MPHLPPMAALRTQWDGAQGELVLCRAVFTAGGQRMPQRAKHWILNGVWKVSREWHVGGGEA